MESLSNIIKNYKPNSAEQELGVVKAVLDDEKIQYVSVRIYQNKIIVTMADHIAATELRYRQKALRNKLAKQHINLEIVSRIS